MPTWNGSAAFPCSSREREQRLAEQFRRDDDLGAARELVLSHLRFVVHIARGYTGYGLPMNDLVQEGNIGLMKAVKRFDPAMGVRLVSFAVHWIRAEIHEYVLRNWRLVKVATTKAQRKLFFNLRRLKKNLAWLRAEETAGGRRRSRRHGGRSHARWNGGSSARDLSFDPAPMPTRTTATGRPPTCRHRMPTRRSSSKRRSGRVPRPSSSRRRSSGSMSAAAPSCGAAG